jgi:hypothetical protein
MNSPTRIAAALGIFLLAHAAAIPVAHSANAPNPDSTVAGKPPQELSGNASEVIRLRESGIDESVVLAYVEATKSPFNLSAERRRSR